MTAIAGISSETPETSAAARADLRRAVWRFALLKAPAVLAVIGAIVWLFFAPREVVSPVMTPIWVTVIVFAHMIYTAVLFWIVLLPALERKSAADKQAAGAPAVEGATS